MGLYPKLDHVNYNSTIPDYIRDTDYYDIWCDDIEIYDPTGKTTSIYASYWRLKDTTNGIASLIPGQWVRTSYRQTTNMWNTRYNAMLSGIQDDSKPWGDSGAYVKIKGLKTRFVRELS